jgi:hypothetical protein
MADSVALVRSVQETLAKGDAPTVLGLLSDKGVRDGTIARVQQYADTWHIAQVTGITPKSPARGPQGAAIRLESRLCETGFTRWASNPASFDRRRSSACP